MTKTSQHWSILNEAKDWKIAADIKGGEQYLRIISEYQQCPDIIVWSESLMVIIIIELTVPFEPQNTENHEHKMIKYKDLHDHTYTQVWSPVVYSGGGCKGVPHSHCGHLEALGLGTTMCMPCVRLQRVPQCEFGGGRMYMTGNSLNCEWRCAKYCQHGHPLMRMWATLT